MHLDSLVMDLSLILIVAGAATLLMKKLKQPPVLGYIVAGFLISPKFSLFPSVALSQSITSWGEIGIVFLMFALGLEFSFKRIATVGGSAFITAITAMGAMTFIGFEVGNLLGWSTMDCIFLGGMLSMSSTMIILKSYEEYGLKKEKFAQVVLGTMVIEDIVGIFMMIVLTTVSVSKNVSGADLVSDIGVLLIMLVVWLAAGIYLIPTFLKKVDRLLNDELLVIVSLAICFGMVIIATEIGFSSALGAFMAGSILAGTVKSEKIEHLVQPIKDLFGAVFFVSVGMLIDADLLVKYIGPIIIIAVATIAGQMIFATLGMLLSGQSLKTAVCGGFSMVQIGEFSFIVASMGMSLGVISGFLYPIVVCVSVITSFTTPLFIKNSLKAYEWINRRLPAGVSAFLMKNTSENRSEAEKDADWKRYLQKVGTRTLICVAAMFTVYWAGAKGVAPWMNRHFANGQGSYITGMILVVAIIPFIALMHGTSNVLYTKLWLRHRANRLPLLTLIFARILIGAMFIALILARFMHLPFAAVSILALVPAYLIVKSDYMKGVTKGIEISFVANFNEKLLHRRKKDMGELWDGHPWLDESLRVVKFAIQDDKERTVKDIGRNRHVHVGVIRVIRDGKYYSMPSGSFRILKGDILHTMGTAEEIEATMLLMESVGCVAKEEHPTMCLKEYIKNQEGSGLPPEKQLVCIPIEVEDNMFFARKSIRYCGLREKYRASVIGMERDNLPVTHPAVSTVIMPGDLLWIIGTGGMANKMIRDGLLDGNLESCREFIEII